MEIIKKIKQFCFVTLRIKKYQLLSNCNSVFGKPKLFHPLLMTGKGRITFGKNVQMGVVSAPNFYTNYSYLEVREDYSEITIGDNVAISNSFSVECYSKVVVENNVLIGDKCSIMDNDGHVLEADNRNVGIPKYKEVRICRNVFLGSNVIILKGVTIGENSVIGNGSVVTKDIPKNVIAAGNPAKVIRSL